MRKILISLIFLSSFLYSGIKIISIKEGKIDLTLNKSYYKKINKEISQLWDNHITETGNIKLDLNIISRKGVLDSFNIKGMSKGKLFNKEIKKFLIELKKIRINRERTDTGYLTIDVELDFIKARIVKINPISIYKDNSSEIYKEYIQYLRTRKGYSVKDIENIINKKKITITKFMLLAMYNDYILNKEEIAGQFYDLVINQKLNRFIESTEGLYIADYLLREKEYELILEIFPKLSCYFMKEPEQSKCHYFRASAMYHLGNEGYIIPLSKSIDIVPQAKNLFEEIKEKKRIE